MRARLVRAMLSSMFCLSPGCSEGLGWQGTAANRTEVRTPAASAAAAQLGSQAAGAPHWSDSLSGIRYYARMTAVYPNPRGVVPWLSINGIGTKARRNVHFDH